MTKDTLWMNKTSDGEGAIVNIEGDVYYATVEKIEKWLNDEVDHGLPLDKISDNEDK